MWKFVVSVCKRMLLTFEEAFFFLSHNFKHVEKKLNDKKNAKNKCFQREIFVNFEKFQIFHVKKNNGVIFVLKEKLLAQGKDIAF